MWLDGTGLHASHTCPRVQLLHNQPTIARSKWRITCEFLGDSPNELDIVNASLAFESIAARDANLPGELRPVSGRNGMPVRQSDNRVLICEPIFLERVSNVKTGNS